jgi:orotidine-5'-phosphate decarboxylase
MSDRLIVALDLPTIAEAQDMVARLDGVVGFFKLGLWLIFAPGFDGFLAELLGAGRRVFLDAKMFDIGETVRRGVARVAERGVSFVTVHGDRDIIAAAVDGKGDSDLKIFAITALTSLDARGLADLGYPGTVEDWIRDRVATIVSCGCDGIIAAPQDNPNAIRGRAGAQHLLIATPGVRLAGADHDDHKRAGTPGEAIAAGADYLVVGRPIVRSDDPAETAAQFIAQMNASERPV